MPKWKWHLLLNSLLMILWIKFLLEYGFLNDYFLLIFLVFFSSFLSIFPDIDSSKSGIRDIFAVIFASIALIFIIYKFSVESIFLLFFSFIFLYLFFRFFPTKHRGITHKLSFSIFFCLIITIILWIMFNFSIVNFIVYFLVLLSSYLSHLFLDAF